MGAGGYGIGYIANTTRTKPGAQRHWSSELEPDAEMVNFGHRVHIISSIAPMDVEYVSGGQSLHPVTALELLHVPAGHAMHAEEPF